MYLQSAPFSAEIGLPVLHNRGTELESGPIDMNRSYAQRRIRSHTERRLVSSFEPFSACVLVKYGTSCQEGTIVNGVRSWDHLHQRISTTACWINQAISLFAADVFRKEELRLSRKYFLNGIGRKTYVCRADRHRGTTHLRVRTGRSFVSSSLATRMI